jgi:hypothetical protein
MMRSTSRPSYLIQFLVGAIAAVALVCVPQAAFAQRGGGGHGGGGGHFSGGGGGHFGGGGGGHFGGASHGGSHEYAPRSGMRSGGPGSGASGSGASGSGAAVRPRVPSIDFGHGNPTVISHGASPASFARPVGPATGFAAGHGAEGAAGEAAAVPQHVTIGFPPAGGAGGFVTPGSARSGAAGWRPIAPIHGGNGGVLTFSGQGHEIWQNRSGEGASRPANSSPLLELRPMESQRVRPFPPRRSHGGFFVPGYGYYGYGFGGFYPWGFGLGLSFGCDPLWDFGCDAYGYPGYGYYGPYAPGFYLNSYTGDENVAAAPDTSQDYGVYSDQNTAPNDSSEASVNGTTVLYLNDGTSFTVTDYWVANYELHYITDGARENAIDLDQIDVQRTVDENAARGVNFTLSPAPGSAQR